jgi:deoxyribodipyrimidine photolyase-like uncharacterized protein
MVLSNLATLLDVHPREIIDWFWVAYTDAYDWVVEPNVLAMGTFAVGEFMTTKPYISGATYIDRMSDFCGDCRFDPQNNCPITNLYWAFLSRHEKLLSNNPPHGHAHALWRSGKGACRKKTGPFSRRSRSFWTRGKRLGLRICPQINEAGESGIGGTQQ